MKREDTGVLPVVEKEGSKRLLGVVTDRDLALRVIGEGRNGDTQISDIMSGGKLTTAKPDDSVDRVMETMGAEQVRRIPIVDERGDLVGIVSAGGHRPPGPRQPQGGADRRGDLVARRPQ